MGRKNKKGGQFPDPNYNDGGTGITDLPEDIIGVVNYTIGSIVSGVDVMTGLINLPGDMGTAFSETNAPNPDNVQIPKL